MAGGLLGKLNVLLTAETAQFTGALDKAASRAAHRLGIMRSDMQRTGKIIGAALVAGATGFAIKMKQIVDDADELSKMSRKIGVSIQSLSAFRLAADLAGTSFEVLTKGIGRFSRNASDAANGLATPRRAFEYLDVAIQNSDGSLRNVEDMLLDVADKFSKMEDSTKKAALAQELFGRAGFELIPFLNEGRDGIEAIRKQAEELGIVFDKKTARSAEMLNDNITRLKASANSYFISIASDLVPALVNMSDELVDNAKSAAILRTKGASLAEVLLNLATAGELIAVSYRSARTAMGDLMAASDSIVKTKISWKDFVPILNIAHRTEGARLIFQKTGRDISDDWDTTMTRIEERYARLWASLRNNAEQSQDALTGGRDGQESRERMLEMLKEGAELAERMRTPLEKLSDEQAHLTSLLEAGAISQETYTRAAEDAADKYDKAIEKGKKSNETLRDLGTTFSSAMEDAIVKGGTLRDIMQGLGEDILRIAARQAIISPLIESVFGDTGLLSGFFQKKAKGDAFYAGNVTRFAKGGIVGSATQFAMSGGRRGLMGEQGYEGIFPLVRTPSGDLGVKGQSGGAQVEVNVYAPAGSDVQQERQNVGGIEKINIFIDQAVADNISRQGSKTSQALRNNYGVKPGLIGR